MCCRHRQSVDTNCSQFIVMLEKVVSISHPAVSNDLAMVVFTL